MQLPPTDRLRGAAARRRGRAQAPGARPLPGAAARPAAPARVPPGHGAPSGQEQAVKGGAEYLRVWF